MTNYGRPDISSEARQQKRHPRQPSEIEVAGPCSCLAWLSRCTRGTQRALETLAACPLGEATQLRPWIPLSPVARPRPPAFDEENGSERRPRNLSVGVLIHGGAQPQAMFSTGWEIDERGTGQTGEAQNTSGLSNVALRYYTQQRVYAQNCNVYSMSVHV